MRLPGVQEQRRSTEKLLSQACARNTTVELHYDDPTTRATTVARARLLVLAGPAVLTDRPTYPPGSDRIPEHRPIRAFFMLGNNHYAFKTTIQQSSAQVRLNAHQALRGLELQVPGKIESIQRRAHYRVRVSGLDFADVELARPEAGCEDRCLTDGRIGPGRVINLSAGGITLLFATSVLKEANIGDRFFGTLRLPDPPQEWYMLLEVRHTKLVSSSASLLVGLSFRPWIGGELPRAQRALTRVVTELERKLLQRTH